MEETFILTQKGSDWSSSYMNEVGTEFKNSVAWMIDDIQQGIPIDTSNYDKQLSYALSRGYITRDERSSSQIISDISRYDRDLGKILKVYNDIGLRKPIRDEDLQEALFNAYEKAKPYPTLEDTDRPRDAMLNALRSTSKSTKIEALDTWVRRLHREGLLWHSYKNVPESLSTDVVIILDRLRDE